jgi:exosortase/archaeosortase family protein
MLYAFCLGLFLTGLRIIFMWGHTSKLIGLGLVFLSISIAYIVHIKNEKTKESVLIVNKKNIFLGLSLIAVDLIYNFLSADALRSFDYGMLISGLFIILLNTNLLNFLKLDKTMTDFISYFLFIFMVTVGTIGTGVTFINNFIHDTHGLPNPIYMLVTDLAIKSSVFILNYIKETTLTNNIVNFDGFKVAIAYPCSGVESLTVFLSSIIAYFIAKKESNIKRITIGILTGVILLYSLNILRIVTIILVGYSYGTGALHFAHNNLGWIFFVSGMFLFWYFITKDEKEN